MTFSCPSVQIFLVLTLLSVFTLGFHSSKLQSKSDFMTFSSKLVVAFSKDMTVNPHLCYLLVFMYVILLFFWEGAGKSRSSCVLLVTVVSCCLHDG